MGINGLRYLLITISAVKLTNVYQSTILAGKKSLAVIKRNYCHAQYYNQYINGIAGIIKKEYKTLAEAGAASMMYVLEQFGMHHEVYMSSDLHIASKGTDRLIELCKAVGADKYISGHGGRGYMQEEKFDHNGIQLIYSSYTNFEYRQQFGELGFIPNLSVIDFMLNCGADPSKL